MSAAGDLDLDRIIRIAEFRAELRTFISRSEEVSRRWGLTPQRYLLLLMIKGAADRSQRLSFTELAERLKLSRNSVTELVTRAEELGLVKREPASHDARVVYVRLTEDGDRRVCAALKDSDEYRREIATAFARLTRAYRGAARTS